MLKDPKQYFSLLESLTIGSPEHVSLEANFRFIICKLCCEVIMEKR